MFARTTPPTTIPPQFSTFNNLKTTESVIPSAVTTISTTVSHIPIYQYNNYFSPSHSARIQTANDIHGCGTHSLAAVPDSINRTEMSTFRRIQHEPINSQSGHDTLNQQFIYPPPASMTSVAQTQTINQAEHIYGQSISPPTLYQRQPFPMNQNQLHREQLTELLRQSSTDVAYANPNVAATFEQNRMRSASPRTQSYPEQNAQIVGSPNRFQQLQYYSNATPATIDQQDGPTYGDTRLDNLNKFYRTTMTLQGQHPPNDEFDEPIGKVLLKRDVVYNKLGNLGILYTVSMSIK